MSNFQVKNTEFLDIRKFSVAYKEDNICKAHWIKLKADHGQRLLQAQLFWQVTAAIIFLRITSWEALIHFIELYIGKESWDPNELTLISPFGMCNF